MTNLKGLAMLGESFAQISKRFEKPHHARPGATSASYTTTQLYLPHACHDGHADDVGHFTPRSL
jgi:hypothetical protein